MLSALADVLEDALAEATGREPDALVLPEELDAELQRQANRRRARQPGRR
jgi:hypothetical protein